MHWAEAFFTDDSDEVIATGISPSGAIHIGNMREILTGDILSKAAVRRKKKTRFIYLGDDADPLRKVYPFLPASYSEHVGKPLYRIPAPEGKQSYSEYYLAPFLKTLDIVNVRVEVIRSSDLYKNGTLAEAAKLIFENIGKVEQILQEVSQRKLESNWAPYNPMCSMCGRITTTTVTGISFPYVEYTCKCGNSGKSDVRKDDGKLPWRLEWPAKWFALGVTTEPFGKDHGAAGGSYDTGKRIAEEIFHIKAPKPMMFERILLKGKGVMHSSTGINVSAYDFVSNSPPEALRYILAKNQPSRHINFDPGLGLLSVMDEMEKYRRAYFGLDRVSDENLESILLYSSVTGMIEKPAPVSFRHLVTLIQIYRDPDSIIRLARVDAGGEEIVRREIEIARRWLSSYAPEEIKFKMLPADERVNLPENERQFILALLKSIEGAEWDAENIHNVIHESIKACAIDQEEGFMAIYRLLIGKEKGPRLGYFLYGLGKEFVTRRLRINA
ncbi:MAG: lysine--tRNA ligase [Candidatus Thermoplasmatota archaeon]|jgi:lysyl-tRNA synthetase class 1|nr:lysine--tRNA ligase [Candidatus Thermoplasmatota archaeon]